MSEAPRDTATRIIQAARSCLLTEGYAKLSTRKTADTAGVPLSQIHYHFGGKQGLVLALLDHENRQLIDRQKQMYGSDTPLWKRYEQACDFLDEDLTSGYVRVLQEMIAAGWSDSTVARQVIDLLNTWLNVLEGVAREAEERFGALGPFTADEVAALVGLSFLGGEAVILLDDPAWTGKARAALRSVGKLIQTAEEKSTRRARPAARSRKSR
jgi:AcrR family transcriptional regulator